MSRLNYSLPSDVVRRAFGGVVTSAGTPDVQTAIDNSELLGTQDDRETITARLEAVESSWDREATPMRAVQIGSADAPRYFDAKGSPWPVKIYLNHMNIAPIDANAGDFIQTRTARDTYTDITADEGTAWTADYEQGVITIYRLPGAGQLPAFHRIRDKFVKVNYRLAAGGDLFNAGETTVTESLTDTQTGTVSVADASRLPRSTETMLLGGSEYVTVSGVDHDADTVSIDSRGVRYTDAESHDSGDTLHYCPLDVRDAVAAQTAREIANTELWSEAFFDSNDIDRASMMEEWQREWDRTVNTYSNRAGYQ